MRLSRRIFVFLAILTAINAGRSTARSQEAVVTPAATDVADAYDYYLEDDFANEESDRTIEDSQVQAAAMLLQQPPALTTPEPARQPAPRRATASRAGGVRLASVPNMLGDCGMTTATVSVIAANGAVSNGTIMFPIVGGARTAKMAENDISLPVDRVFFNYNHFSNAFEMEAQQAFPPGATQFRTEPVDRYTIGFEKTYFDGWASVEMRMPFSGSFDADLQSLNVTNGNVGNLAVILKGLLYQDDRWGFGIGLGIDTPTGSDTVARLGTTNLELQNEAVHLLPYVGFLYAPGDPQWGWNDTWFASGFLQVDVAASGNTVRLADPAGGGGVNLGKFNEQHQLFADLGVGYWLYRDPCAPRWTGLSVIGELHYSTSIHDPDLVAGTFGGAAAAVSNPSGRFDVFNGTIGIQALMFDCSSLRVAASFPFGTGEDKRFYDSEVQVQFNRRF
jgi:hypothetical protein